MIPRNVLNVEEVEAFLDDIAAPDDPAIGPWLRRTARRWILNHHETCRRVIRDSATDGYCLVDPEADAKSDAEPYTGDVPDWVPAALAGGGAVVVLILDARLAKRVRRVVDYLSATRYGVDRPDFDRLGFEQAEQMARAWRRARAKERRRRRSRPGAQSVFNGGSGIEIFRLTTPSGLRDEGQRMQHCVGAYAEAVRDGECQIFSVRNQDGESRATIEVDRAGRVIQAKGTLNGGVPVKYRAAMRRFVQAKGYVVVHDRYNFREPLEAADAAPGRGRRAPRWQEILARLSAYRYTPCDDAAGADCEALVNGLLSRARRLERAQLNRILDALLPDAGAPIRLYRRRIVEVYGERIPIISVAAPMPLINVARDRTFRRTDRWTEARAVVHEVEARLAALALHDPDHLHFLGRTYVDVAHWNAVWSSTGHVARFGAIDLAAVRRRRHDRLRRALNEAKRRTIGRAAPASPAHRTVRRLLAGARGEYVI